VTPLPIARLTLDNLFPNPDHATKEGIVAFGGDLSPSRLVEAYRQGIFPWYSEGDPIVWWSPNPRLILKLDDFKLRRSLKKRMKHFTYKFDTAFVDVMTRCAQSPRKDQEGTWILPEVIEAYSVLHSMGIAHSVEAYVDGKLVGGAYGIVVGSVFCGESMFASVNDASKAAFAVLVRHLKEWGYDFIDCQIPTPHLKSLGAKEVTREYFLEQLNKGVDRHLTHPWIVDGGLL
jgi:leucyl/phenylalanyl-tRNA---protein transferase